jgi:predicted amidohydrolase YtcJ
MAMTCCERAWRIRIEQQRKEQHMPVADTIFSNGDIVTMDEAAPAAEALAIKDGRILAIGASADVLRTRGPGTIMVDLGGKTLLPGFFDGHSHFINSVRMAD